MTPSNAGFGALCFGLALAAGCEGRPQSPADDTGGDPVDSRADSADSVGESRITRGQADFGCPIVDGVEEQILEVEIEELDGLFGHGISLGFHTDTPALATVFFGPSDAETPCHQAVSSGWYQQDHSIEVTNLRLDAAYQLVVKLEHQDGPATRSAVVRFRTRDAVQPLAANYVDVGVAEGSVRIDAELYGDVPGDLVIATSLGLCGQDFGGPSTATHVQLFDREGFLVGHYLGSDEVQGYSQNHVTVTGSPGYSSGNERVRLELGGGIPQWAMVSSFDLEGGLEEYLQQPSFTDGDYSLGYTDRVIEDTSGLVAAGMEFVGRAHLAIRSTKEDGEPRTEVFFWDEGLVTEDNRTDPEAWTVWGYRTVDLTGHPQIPTPSNSVAYNPVRNELVIHTHNTYGGLLWGLDIALRRVNWVFGSRASSLHGSVPDSAALFEEVGEPGACDDPVFARGHGVSVWHGAQDDASSFYVGLHDNGGDDLGRRQHSRAMVYRFRIEDGARSVDVDWAYPSNPLSADDPFHDSMGVFSRTHGGLEPVPGHDDLFLLTQGSGYCYEEANELGFVNREHIVLLRSVPQDHTAEVLAIYTPGTEDFARVTLYAATPTQLYAQICEDEASSGSHSFALSAL